MWQVSTRWVPFSNVVLTFQSIVKSPDKEQNNVKASAFNLADIRAYCSLQVRGHQELNGHFFAEAQLIAHGNMSHYTCRTCMSPWPIRSTSCVKGGCQTMETGYSCALCRSRGSDASIG